MVCPVPSGLLYARLPDCTGCGGQLGFISVAVDNRERKRDGEIWKRGKREIKREKNKKHWEERGCSKNSRKSLFSLLLRNKNDLLYLLNPLLFL